MRGPFADMPCKTSLKSDDLQPKASDGHGNKVRRAGQGPGDSGRVPGDLQKGPWDRALPCKKNVMSKWLKNDMTDSPSNQYPMREQLAQTLLQVHKQVF